MNTQTVDKYIKENGFNVEQTTDRRSIAFFIQLRNTIREKVGIPDEHQLSTLLMKTGANISDLFHIEDIVRERSVGHIGKKIIDWVRDHLRDRINPNRISDTIIQFSGVDRSVIEKVNNDGLMQWKKYILSCLQKMEQHQKVLDMLEPVEFPPELNAIMKQYNAIKLSDLLRPGIGICNQEMMMLISTITKVLVYRNRKINQLLAYRYARTAPPGIDIEQFVADVNSLFTENEDEVKQKRYRKHNLKTTGEFYHPFPPDLIPHCMSWLRNRITETDKLETTRAVEKEALKMYILFLMIHPLDDANGRTGGALFVFLQRYYAKYTNKEAPLYIPIAGYESGTIYASHEGAHRETRAGSMSVDIHNRLEKIAQRNDIRAHRKASQDISSQSAIGIGKDTFDHILRTLDSDKMEEELDIFLSLIREQNQRENMHGKDWQIIYSSLKENLQ